VPHGFFAKTPNKWSVFLLSVIYFNQRLKNLVKRAIHVRPYRRKYNIAKLMLNIIIPHVGIVQSRIPKSIEAPSATDCTFEYDDAEKVPETEKDEGETF
jgi:hypothetical protein